MDCLHMPSLLMQSTDGCGNGNKIALTVGKHFREEFGSTVEVVAGEWRCKNFHSKSLSGNVGEWCCARTCSSCLWKIFLLRLRGSSIHRPLFSQSKAPQWEAKRFPFVSIMSDQTVVERMNSANPLGTTKIVANFYRNQNTRQPTMDS